MVFSIDIFHFLFFIFFINVNCVDIDFLDFGMLMGNCRNFCETQRY